MPKASTAPDTVVVIGRGRAGRALASALRSPRSPGDRAPGTRFAVSLSAGRRPSRAAIARSSVVVIAVPDPAIEATAQRIADWLAPGTIVLHLAGSRGTDVLSRCARSGAEIGVMHPLVAMPARGARLAGSTFVIDGTRPAIAGATRIARQVGARALVARVHGPAYHAAAAMLANGATALAAASTRVLVELGVEERDARVALGALLSSTGANVSAQGATEALTGPIVRGDAGTIARHRDAIAALDREALAAYDAIAPVILGVARDAGLDATRARAISAALRARPRSARLRSR